MSELQPEENTVSNAEGWDSALPQLRDEFPDTSDGILFCVFKLRQDRELSFKDFRDEAQVRGIGLSGRSLHSAKVLLGWEQPAKRRKKEEIAAAAPTPKQPKIRAAAAAPVGDPSATLLQAVQQMQDAANAESEHLKDAIRSAIDILRAALDD